MSAGPNHCISMSQQDNGSIIIGISVFRLIFLLRLVTCIHLSCRAQALVDALMVFLVSHASMVPALQLG